MRNIKSGAALLATCLLACQCIQQQATSASAYVITSQYLGAAPSRGDEHLLLFKIPEPISSQLLESRQQSFQPAQLQQQQQQQQQHLNGRESRLLVEGDQEPVVLTQPSVFQPQVVSHTPIQSTPRLKYEPASSAIVQEQAVSLTIPLSALHTVEPQQQHQPTPPLNFINGLQFNQDTQQQQQQQQQTIASKQVAIGLALADYLNVANPPDSNQYNQQQQQQQQQQHQQRRQQQHQIEAPGNQLGNVISVDRALKNGGSRNVFMVQNRPQTAASRQSVSLSLASADREPQLDQRANYSLQASYLTGLSPVRLQNDRPTGETQEAPQASLWRDSQPQLQYASSTSESYQQVSANQSEIAGLIAKLSSSSPDLLMRLRNLLKRAANVRHQNGATLVGSSAGGLGEAFGVAKQSPSGDGLRVLDRSLTHFQNDVDGNSELLVANNVSASELRNMVQEYVSSQQQLAERGAPAPNSFGPHSVGTLLSSQNVTSHQEIKIPLIVIAMPRILSLKRNQMAAAAGPPTTKSPHNASGLPTLTSELVQRLIRQHQDSPQMLTATNLSSSASPFSEPTNGQPALVQQPGQQANYSGHVNTSHTYWLAQQQVTATTSLPLHTMAPYARQFMPGLVSAPLIRNEFLPFQHQHTLFYPSNQSDYLMANAHSHTASGQLQAIGESMLVSRQNGTASSQLLPVLEQSGNSVQLQLIHSPPSGRPDHQSKSGGHIQLVSRAQQPLYEIRPEADSSADAVEPHNEQQQQQQQQQYVYLNAEPQRRASRLLGNFTEEPGRSAFNDLPEAEPSGRLTATKPRLSLFEEQIGRLRPLFQSPIKREHAANHLSANQMLTLLSRSQEGRLASADRLQQFAGGNAELGLDKHWRVSAAQKQSPKMLLMVV